MSHKSYLLVWICNAIDSKVLDVKAVREMILWYLGYRGIQIMSASLSVLSSLSSESSHSFLSPLFSH